MFTDEDQRRAYWENLEDEKQIQEDLDGGRGQATSLLAHYFKVVFEASGLNWNSDNEAEIKKLVDCIIDESQTEGCDPMELHPLSPYGLK